MPSRFSESKVSTVLIAKCSQCKVKSELVVCEVCDEAKCKTCAAQHRMEAEERWDTIEESLREITNVRSKSFVVKSIIQLTQK